MNSLWICDPDGLFLKRLTAFAENRAAFPFQVQTFTSLESLYAALEKKKPDMLLLAEEIYKEKEWQDFEGCLLLLGSGVGEEKGPERIFRYQEAGTIVKELLLHYRQRQPLPAENCLKAHFKIWGVFSPAECEESEVFALELARHLGGFERVLLVDLAGWPVLESLLGKNAAGRMGEILYYLCKKPKELYSFLQLQIESDGKVDYLPPAEIPEDLLQVKAEDWKVFLNTLKLESPYTMAVLVLGNLLQPAEEVAGLCDRVFGICPEGQERKSKSWQSYLEKRGAKELRGKIYGLACGKGGRKGLKEEAGRIVREEYGK